MDRRTETDSQDGNCCLEASIKANYLTLIDRVLFIEIILVSKKSFSSVFHASTHKGSDKVLCFHNY
jgi:hypothetical protein